MAALIPLLVAILAVFSTGCVIPAESKVRLTPESRAGIGKRQCRLMIFRSEATRESVVLTLGSPTFVDDERGDFIYQIPLTAHRQAGVFLLLGAIGPFETGSVFSIDHWWRFRFGPDGRLLAVRWYARDREHIPPEEHPVPADYYTNYRQHLTDENLIWQAHNSAVEWDDPPG